MIAVKRHSNLFPSVPSLFEDFFNRDAFNAAGHGGHAIPPVNIRETEQDFQLEVVAPGLDKNEFRIELKDHVLTIVGEKEEKAEDTDKDGRYTRREFRFASFKRAFTLPEHVVDGERIEARYTNGVLHISIPKIAVNKSKNPRLIEIG